MITTINEFKEEIMLNEDNRNFIQKMKDKTINPLKSKMTNWKGGDSKNWSDSEKNGQDNKVRMHNQAQMKLLKNIQQTYNNLQGNYKKVINIEEINNLVKELESSL